MRKFAAVPLGLLELAISRVMKDETEARTLARYNLALKQGEKQLKDIGMSTTYGIQATEFDADTATDSTRIGQNSAVFAAYSGTATA
mgnify:CR=1 FL=1